MSDSPRPPFTLLRMVPREKQHRAHSPSNGEAEMQRLFRELQATQPHAAAMMISMVKRLLSYQAGIR